jgi:hypothetical protein
LVELLAIATTRTPSQISAKNVPIADAQYSLFSLRPREPGMI